jgi:hypothetical protein
MRLIDADELRKTIKEWISDHWNEAVIGDDVGFEFLYMVDDAPTVSTPDKDDN